MLEPVASARELALRRWTGYAVASGAALGAISLQLLLGPWLGDSLLPLTLAVLAAAWYGGWGPGLAATALSAALADYYLLPPPGAGIAAPVDRAQLVALLVVGVVVSRICEAFRVTGRRFENERARLRESDAFHAAIADLSTDFAFSARVEADGSIVTEAVTDGFFELLGFTLAELPGRGGWSGLVHPRDAERVREELRQLLRGRTVLGEARHVARDARVLRLQYRMRPLWDGRGRVVRVYGAYRDVTREREAEHEARERERQLRLVTDHAPVLIAHHDAATRFKFANGPYAARFGRKPGDLVGRPLREVLGDEIHERLAPHVEAALAGRSVEFEGELPAEGGPEPVRFTFVPERDRTGVVGFVAAIVSVADQRRAREALRESEARFRQLAEAMPHIAFTVTPEGAVEYVNSQWYAFSGRPEDEGFGLGWMQVLHPDDYADAYRRWTHSLRSGEPFETEYRFRDAGGSFRWHLCRALPVRDAAGAVVKWVGTSTDVHEQRLLTEQLGRERAALARSERLYRAIGESIEYGVWVCDPEGRNVYASESFLRLVGLTQEQCAGFGWLRALHPEQAAGTLAAWQDCVRSGGKWDVEQLFLGADGRQHPVLARGVPVQDAEGRTVAWAGIHLDIARLKDAEEALRAADRRKDEFLATLAHELRNPLNPIRSAVEVLRLKGGSEPEQRWSRDVIDRQVDHLTRLIDDLLDVSRISRGKLELRREAVELRRVVRGAIEASRPLVEQLAHQLAVELPDEPLFVHGDEVRLTQVFTNLLTNAAKYTERGGRISVAGRREGNEAVVCVSDTGVGIAPEKLPHLFEMFYQVDRSLERAQGGLGIGLSLVKQLVAMHGGTIRARSGGIGQGSEFVVALPLQPAPLPAPAPAPPARRRENVARRRILVADDNADSASSLALLLQLGGHEVATAGDGEEAFAKASGEPPDVMLLDLGMPKLNGYEVCRRVRAEPWGRDVLMIAQTGWGQDEDRRRTREAGFDAHLVKPVEPATLISLIQRLALAPRTEGRREPDRREPDGREPDGRDQDRVH